MPIARIGEVAALGTAVCWTVTSMSFESAGRRVGSLAVNIVRLVIALGLLSVWTTFTRGRPLPTDFPLQAWGWLALSGIAGFALGDLFLFRAFVVVGSRVSMLVMSAVPPLTAILGWLALGETLGRNELIGMALTVGGIALVVLERPARRPADAATDASPRPASRLAPRVAVGGTRAAGVLLAFGGALGQAVGLVLGKKGMGALDPFAATQIRALAGLLGFAVLFTILRRWDRVGAAVRDASAMRRITAGAVFGPFLGVSLSLLAVQHTATGVASTIMAIVPVLIIAPSVVLFRERVTPREILGALIAVAGVAMMFLRGNG